jgi:2-C-methyl-D-erythritol 4-phosphate cytidylyltransferase/2-C-methyl-D-erythritol 2,4-cyclodiphosphate synthase
MTVWGIVAAGGSGRRFGGDKLAAGVGGGQTVLNRAIANLLAGGVERVVVVGSADPAHDLAEFGERVAAQIAGGSERAASVAAGLAQIPADVEFVAVHDGARPFASPDLVAACIARAMEVGAAVPVLPAVDTLAQADDGVLAGVLERHRVVHVQTPQVIRRVWLEEVVAAGGDTDESTVLQRLGHPVGTVPGEGPNKKITRAEDLPMETATGFGFDVHRYDPQRTMILGGVTLPGEVGLAGHSDADVLLHALVDALLGAIGAGDIGDHFPPSEARWQGADSSQFVAHALALLSGGGGRLVHVDCTVIGEMPRLTPHKPAMRARLAELLGLPEAAVNLKATTTERLGFTGRGEGLAAQVVVTITRPPARRGLR